MQIECGEFVTLRIHACCKLCQLKNMNWQVVVSIYCICSEMSARCSVGLVNKKRNFFRTLIEERVRANNATSRQVSKRNLVNDLLHLVRQNFFEQRLFFAAICQSYWPTVAKSSLSYVITPRYCQSFPFG